MIKIILLPHCLIICFFCLCVCLSVCYYNYLFVCLSACLHSSVSDYFYYLFLQICLCMCACYYLQSCLWNWIFVTTFYCCNFRNMTQVLQWCWGTLVFVSCAPSRQLPTTRTVIRSLQSKRPRNYPSRRWNER